LTPARRLAAVLGVVLGTVLIAPAAGQIVSQVSPRALLQFPREGIDKPIDPSTYRIVPGDIFALGLWGIADTVLTVGVGPEGSVVIPSVGVIPLSGSTLQDGERLVAGEVHKIFPAANVTLNLLTMGAFRVEVTGLVPRPGGYPATGVQRVRDVLLQAGDLLAGGTHRRILITNDGETRRVDFVRWILDGDLDNNPVLEPGMRIHVPPRGPTFRLRGPIQGGWEPMQPPQQIERLPQPQQVALEWIDGDTVQEAIDRAGGLTPDAVADMAYVWRYEAGGLRSQAAEVVELAPDSADVPVYPGDLVDIPYRTETVAVTGAVNIPGRYPFLAGWTARDYVNAAGGPSAIGKSGGWKLTRDGDDRGIDPGDSVAPADMIRVGQSASHKASVWLPLASTAVAVVLSVIAIAR